MIDVDHSRMRLGRTPPKPEHKDAAPHLKAFLTPELPTPPPDVDYLSCMSTIPMLGNDQYGDCVFAMIAHILQAQTAALGRERVFTTEETLSVYARATGFNRGDSSTDNGANLFEALSDVKVNGFAGIEIEGFARINVTNYLESRQALMLFGPLAYGVALPLSAQRQNVWRTEIGLPDDQITPGGWGGHGVAMHRSTIQADGRPLEVVSTWGAAKDVEETYRDAGYVEEAFCVFLKGWIPPNVPGFDRDGLLAAMKGLSR